MSIFKTAADMWKADSIPHLSNAAQSNPHDVPGGTEAAPPGRSHPTTAATSSAAPTNFLPEADRPPLASLRWAKPTAVRKLVEETQAHVGSCGDYDPDRDVISSFPPTMDCHRA